jgi:lysophospholipid acyltransferase (LPLAT)-like uncharacterized protein
MQNNFLPQQILGFIVHLFYKVLASTYRYHFKYEDHESFGDIKPLERCFGKNQNIIYAFWHQDELALMNVFTEKNVVAMVSHSKDGTIMSTALNLSGYKTVRGSSSKGGMRAFLEGLKLVKEGYSFTMAVDGPRGPIYKVKEGITKMSEKTKRPILPVKGFPRNYYLFHKSWNQARLPLPFSRIDVKIGRLGFYTTEELEETLSTMKY